MKYANKNTWNVDKEVSRDSGIWRTRYPPDAEHESGTFYIGHRKREWKSPRRPASAGRIYDAGTLLHRQKIRTVRPPRARFFPLPDRSDSSWISSDSRLSRLLSPSAPISLAFRWRSKKLAGATSGNFYDYVRHIYDTTNEKYGPKIMGYEI